MPRLLLADASPMMRRVIELTFANEGMEVLTARDGEHAIALISAERPDIVLADHALPGRSGYDVTAFVKRHPELARIPVVLLSGAFEPADKIRAAQVGCDAILVKPFEPQQAIARVRELLDAASTRRTGDAEVREPDPGGSDDPFGALHEALGQLGAAREGIRGRTLADGIALEADTGEESTVPTVDALLGGPPAAAEENPEPLVSRDAQAAAGPIRAAQVSSEASAATAPPPPTGLASEDLIDEVTRRVLERLATDTIHPVVARVVGEIAERLLREELERLRNGAGSMPAQRT
jgi:CheY-like chemotaxis protein